MKGDVKRTKESFSAGAGSALVLREFPQKEKPALECRTDGGKGPREGDKVGPKETRTACGPTSSTPDLACATHIWGLGPVCFDALSRPVARWPSRAHVCQTDPCEKESRSHRNQHRSLPPSSRYRLNQCF